MYVYMPCLMVAWAFDSALHRQAPAVRQRQSLTSAKRLGGMLRAPSAGRSLRRLPAAAAPLLSPDPRPPPRAALPRHTRTASSPRLGFHRRHPGAGAGAGLATDTATQEEVWAAWPLLPLPRHLLLAAGVTSFWRGAWYVLDSQLFPDSLLLSGGCTLTLGWGGFTVLHYGLAPAIMARPCADSLGRPLRTAVLYLTGLSVVCCWRGVWVLWDALFEASAGAPDGLASGLTSHVAGAGLLLLGGHFTALLAPPARIAMLPDIIHLARGGDLANFVARTPAKGGPASNDPHTRHTR